MNILDGNVVADKILARSSVEVARGKRPCLAVLLAGEDPASKVYVRNKHRMCEKAGVKSLTVNMLDATTDDVLKQIDQWNNDPEIHGILVQLPLPKGVDKNKVLARVNPKKDVDGFHPENLGLLAAGETRFLPCTVAGVLEIIKHYEIPTVGRRVVIINRSNTVGIPLAVVMARPPYNSTVAVCHEFTTDLESECRTADIIVPAVGKEDFHLPAYYVRPHAAVIDVGIRRVDNKIIGDYRPHPNHPCRYTPVPGGVGPCTVSCLIQNVVSAANRE